MDFINIDNRKWKEGTFKDPGEVCQNIFEYSEEYLGISCQLSHEEYCSVGKTVFWSWSVQLDDT